MRYGKETEVIWASVGTAFLSGAAAIFLLAPQLLALAPACTFKVLSGIPCLTCGGTRAMAALMAGHPLMALGLNPLIGSAVLGLAAYLPYAWLVAGGWFRPLRPGWLVAPIPAPLRWGVLAAVALNWIYVVVAGR